MAPVYAATAPHDDNTPASEEVADEHKGEDGGEAEVEAEAGTKMDIEERPSRPSSSKSI